MGQASEVVAPNSMIPMNFEAFDLRRDETEGYGDEVGAALSAVNPPLLEDRLFEIP